MLFDTYLSSLNVVGFRVMDGTVSINPENDAMYNVGAEILLLAEDDDAYQPNNGCYSLAALECFTNKEERPVEYEDNHLPEPILFFGWRWDVSNLIS